MVYHRLILNFFLFTAILFLTACASNTIYRSQYNTCNYKTSGDCPKNALQEAEPEKEEDYKLSFVEYDDQGQLRDPKQMNAVLDEYQRIAGSEDVLLITFVHGWHHSAAPEDNNIKAFRKLLARISKSETEVSTSNSGRKKRKILGLYIGWRGDSITIPYINDLTFWDRKNTADDVGQLGVSEVLLKLEEIINVKVGIEEANPPPKKSRLIVIGHSFGGAVVYTSLQKILMDRFIDSRPGKTSSDDAKGFGDLVVLMNPAFEAIRFASLYDLSQEGCRNYFKTQLPKLAILTSEADYATKYAFYAGRTMSTLFESHVSLNRHYCSKPGSQGMQSMQIDAAEADRNTVGHFKPYLTHKLAPITEQKIRKDDLPITQLQTIWSEHTNTNPVDFGQSLLISLGRTTPLNPYLNIKVDKEIIKNHNDIWGPQIVDFIHDLIIISTTTISSETQ